MTGIDHPAARSGGVGGLRQRFHATFTPVGQAMVALLALALVLGVVAGVLVAVRSPSRPPDVPASTRPLAAAPVTVDPEGNGGLDAGALRGVAEAAMAAYQDGDDRTARWRVAQADSMIPCSLRTLVGFLAGDERDLVRADAAALRRDAGAIVAVVIARPSPALQRLSATGHADLFAVMVAEVCPDG